MKKIIFLLALLFMASVSNVNAQLFVQKNQEVTLGKTEIAPEQPSKADYLLKYYVGTTFAGLGSATYGVGTFYSHGCISFTAAQVYNYAGGQLTQINFYFPAASQNLSLVPSSGKVWIKNSLSGAVVYEQSCTVTPGAWNNVPLTTPQTLTTSSLVIGFSVTHITTSGTTNEIRPMPLTTTGDTYKAGGVNYIIGSTTPNTNGVGATWNVYSTAGNLGIEANVTGVTLPANDLAASTVSAPALKWVGTPSTYAVTVHNTGTASQNSYSVQLIDAANNVLATQAVTTALASGATTAVNVNYTPTAAGNIVVRGKVVLSGDQVAADDISEPLSCKIYPMQPMAYCNANAQGFLTAAAAYLPCPLHVAIGYPAAEITPFLGKKIVAIDVYIDAPPSIITNASVWVRDALSGTDLVPPQTFTPVQGWNSVTLATSYNITSANTFIGATYTANQTGYYPMSPSANTQNAANGGHFKIESSSTAVWNTLAVNYPIASYPNAANWAIVGVVEQGTTAVISTASSPVNGGTTTGGGTYNLGANVTLTATANPGYAFQSWNMGTTVLSTNNPYSFPAATSGIYTAKFASTSGVTCDDYIIGTGTTSHYALPSDYYAYSYSQQIYLASEINFSEGDVIDELSFQYNAATPFSRQNMSFYLVNTTKSAFTGGTDWLLTGLELVYQGNIIFNNSGTDYWYTIELQTPFTYTGDNIAVVCLNSDGTSGNSAKNFLAHTADAVRSIYYYTSSPAINPASPPSGYTNAARCNIKLHACTPGATPGCNPPTNLNVAYAPNCGSAQLTWTAPGKGKGASIGMTDSEIAAYKENYKGKEGMPRVNPRKATMMTQERQHRSVDYSIVKNETDQSSTRSNTAQGYIIYPSSQWGYWKWDVTNIYGKTLLNNGITDYLLCGSYYDGKLYAFGIDEDWTTVKFYTINATTGAVISAVTKAGFEEMYDFEGMAYDPSTNTMRVLLYEFDEYGTDVIATVNLTNGNISNIVPISGFTGYWLIGCAIDQAGTMYVMDFYSDLNDYACIYTVNKTNGNATLKGSTGVWAYYDYQSMAFDHSDGQLYWCASDEDGLDHFMKINPTNGTATMIQTGTYETTCLHFTGAVTPPSDVAYNIYRDGNPTPIASNINTTSYTDATFSSTSAHTWEVKAVCTGGGESASATKAMPACEVPQGDCDPATDINVVFANNCSSAEVTWTAPEGGSSITSITTPNTNNGSGAVTANIIAGAQDVTITGIDVQFYDPGASVVHMYYRTGTACGFAQNSAGWTLIGAVPVNATSAAPTNYHIDFPTAVTIPAGQTYGFYFAGIGNGLGYSGTGTGTCAANTIASNADLTIKGGQAITSPTAPFVGGGGPFQERSFAGKIYYSLGVPTSFNLYRNSVPIAQNTMATSYTDVNFDHNTSNIWAVKVVCPEGGESAPISKTMQPCGTLEPGTCNPVTNLAAAYSSDCMTSHLTWDEPAEGKGSNNYTPVPVTGTITVRKDASVNFADNRLVLREGFVPPPAEPKIIGDAKIFAEAYTCETSAFLWKSIDLATGAKTSVGPVGTTPFPIGEDYNNTAIYRMHDNGLIQTVSQNGTTTNVGTVTGLTSPRGLAYDWITNDGTWYFLEQVGSSPYTNSLYSLNMTTLAKTLIGTFSTNTDFFRGLAMDQNGNLLTVNMSSISLVKLNKTNAQATTVGSLVNIGYPAFGCDLAFDKQENKLYFSTIDYYEDDNVFGTINTTTGLFTKIASYGWVQHATLVVAKSSNMALAAKPTNVVLTPTGTELAGTLSWKNPSTTVGGAALTSITKMVVERDGAWYQDVTPAPVGGNMSIPVTVPAAGLHQFAVYAVTSAGDGTGAFASGLFGKVCVASVNINDVLWGDCFSWSFTNDVTGESVGAGWDYDGSYVNPGTFTMYITGGATFKLWEDSGCGDNGVDLNITLNGEVEYELYMPTIPVNFSTTEDIVCGGFKYNVYRNNVYVGTTKQLFFDDHSYNSSVGHTWSVKAICEDGTGSAPATVTLPACGNTCGDNPATNLAVDYAGDCGFAQLTWDEPAEGKGSNNYKPVPVTGTKTVREADPMKATAFMRAPASTGTFIPTPDDGRAPTTLAYMINCYPGNNVPTKVPLNNPGGSTTIGGSLPELPGGGEWIDGAWYCIAPNSNNIYKINPTTGTYTITAQHSVSGAVGMAYNPANGYVYVSQGGEGGKFYTIDVETGASAYAFTANVAAIGGYLSCFTITNEGRFIALDLYYNDNIVEINPTTGAVTTLFPCGFHTNYIQDMNVDRETNTVYWAAYDATTSAGAPKLCTLNLTNNTVTVIGALPGEMVAFAIPTTNTPNIAKAPTNVTVTPNGTELTGTLSWTNPTLNSSGVALTSITKMVVERNGAWYQDVTPATVGGNMSIPVTVTDAGPNVFTVYAVTSAGNGYKRSAFGLFGKVCVASVNINAVNWGDSFSWSFVDNVTGESVGAGYGYNGSEVSPGTFTLYITGDATFTLLEDGGYGDNGVDLNITLNGDVEYELYMPTIPSGFSTTEDISCSGFKYNVYRDNAYLATVKVPEYKDLSYNAELPHTWAVKVKCKNGGESSPVTANKAACVWTGCPPPLNVVATPQDGPYGSTCATLITWDSPVGKSGVSEYDIANDPRYNFTPVNNCVEKQAEVKKLEPLSAGIDPNAGNYVYQPIEPTDLLRGDFIYGDRLNTWVTPEGHIKMSVTAPGPGTLQSSFSATTFYGGAYYDGYLYGSSSTAPFSIYKINHETGAYTTLSASQSALINSMTYDPVGNVMYGYRAPGSLYTIDLSSGANTLVATLSPLPPSGQFISVFCDATGNMYGIELSNAAPAGFYSINKSTGVCALIGSTGVTCNYAQSATCDYETNTIYWCRYVGSGESYLCTINPATGVASQVSSTYIGEIGACYFPFIAGTPCPALTNLTASVNNNSVTLNWTAPTPAPLNYEISRNGAPQGTVTTTTFTQSGLANDTYNYTVKAIYPAANDCIPVGVSVQAKVHVMPCANGSEITIEGTPTATSYWFPMNAYYGNSYNQMIYDAADIGDPGSIISLGFKYLGSGVTLNNQTIYLGNTTKSVFEQTATTWVPLSELTEVYTGTLNVSSTGGWYTLELTTPFEYTGGNLVIAILNSHGGSGQTSSHTFTVQSGVSQHKVASVYQDGSVPINPLAPGAPGSSGFPSIVPHVKFEVCVVPGGFDIARDGEVLATGIKTTSYLDAGPYDPYTEHEWCVTYVCEDGSQSPAVCVTSGPCKEIGDCASPETLTVTYEFDCTATLDWGGGKSMSSVSKPEIIPTVWNNYEKDALKEEMLTSSSRQYKGTAPIQTPAPKVFRGEIPPAPKGMVNVTLEAHDVWGDGTGFQLLLDATATQYGVTIPATGASVGSFGSTTCSVPATLYDVFTHKIPLNADPVCSTSNMVYDGFVTIQIPAGTYDWGIANPCPGDRIWRVGAGGGPETSGARDNYVFADGLNYHFEVFLYATGNDGVEITTEEAGDPCPALTNLSVTNTGQTVKLAWTAAPGSPLNYVVARDGSTIATVTTTSYTDANVTPGDHNYCVKAVFPPANDCVPQNICQSITIPENLGDGCEGVIVGTATTTGYEVPVNTYWRYSYVQQIYEASTLAGNEGQTMTGIAFQYIYGTPNPKSPVTIYIGHTEKNSFSSSDWVPVSEMTQVFYGALNFNNALPWYTIEFDVPFTYTGGNIVVAILNNHGDYITGSNPTFRYHSAAGKTLHYRVDGSTPINPASPPTATGVLGNRANTRFTFCQSFFNVYRDGEMIAQEHAGTTYTDFTFNPYEGHTWCVAPICPNGWEPLEPVCATMPQCAPPPCEVEIGSGATTTYQVPVNTYYGSSYTQQIFDASEINLPAGTEINAIAFQYIYGTPNPKNPLSVYLGNTTKSAFSSSDWVPVSQMTQVFTPKAVTFNNSETWYRITFDVPFVYDGTSNIVVAVLNNNNAYTTSSNPTFRYHSATGKTLHYRVDGSTVNVTSPPSATGVIAERNNIQFLICEFEHDLAAVSITGNCNPAVGVPYTYVVNVTNKGIETETDYLVEVRTSDNIILGTAADVPAIAPGETQPITVYPVTYFAPGEVCIKGAVLLEGDQDPVNNSTKPYNCFDVRPFSQDDIIDIPCDPWVGTKAEEIPFNFYWKSSMVQSIYLQSEISMAGGFVKSVSWFYNATTGAPNKPVKVWLANTNVSTVSAGWYPETNFTLVYEGNVSVSSGAPYQLTVQLVEPFLYTGGNLIVMTERIMDTEYMSGVTALVSPGSARTREYHSDSTPFNWTQAGTVMNTVANLELVITRVPYGKVDGTITKCADGMPLEGVTVSLDKYGLTTTTDANGDYFFPFVPAEKDYTFSAIKFLYHDVFIGPFDVNEGDEIKYDFCMTLRPGFTVFGVVMGSDESYLEGAILKLKGYDDRSAVAGPYGVFEFYPPVLWSELPYTLTVTHPGWQTHTSEWIIMGNTNMGTIILYDVPYPSTDVVAEEINDNLAHIYWDQTFEPPVPPYNEWIKWCVNDEIVGGVGYSETSGENMTIAMRFTPQDLESLGVQSGHKITKVALPVRMNMAQVLSMEIRIWEGGTSVTNAGTLVYTQPVTGWTAFPESSMAEIELTTPFVIDADKEIRVGWNLVNTAGYPFGRDSGPVVAGKGDLFYCAAVSSSWLSHYDYMGWNYNYSLKAFVSGGGKSADVVLSTENIPVEKPIIIDAQPTHDFAPYATNVGAVVEPEMVVGRDVVPHNPADGIVGYKLWRLLPGQEEDETVWSTLTNIPVPAMEYNDNTWASTAPGVYKWAVKTCYNMGVISAPAFSNDLIKYGKTTYVINVITNSGDPATGALVELDGDFYYSDVVELNSVIFQNMVVGTYDLTVTLAGYEVYEAQLDIFAAGSYTVTLIEIISAPTALAVDTADCNATLTWNHIADGVDSYNVYLDDVLVADGVTAMQYVFVNLSNGAHTAGVQAYYTSGVSEIITKDFVINCVGINTYDKDGYKLYPNPANNHIFVARESATLATIDLYNAMGMHISSYETGEAIFKINVVDLAAGTYFIRITEGSNSIVKNFVKKNDK